MIIYENSYIKKYEKFDILQCTTCQIDTKCLEKCKKVRIGKLNILGDRYIVECKYEVPLADSEKSGS